MRGFGGFPSLGFPGARCVYHRRGHFPLSTTGVVGTGGGIVIGSLPAMRGTWEVWMMALAQPVGAAASIDLLAVNAGSVAGGGAAVGRARLATDALDGDGATVRSIASNTPVVFHMLGWLGNSDRLNIIGETYNGVIAAIDGATNTFITNYVRPTFISTADVVDGPLDLVIQAVTATSGVFVVDEVYAYEWPDIQDQWY